MLVTLNRNRRHRAMANYTFLEPAIALHVTRLSLRFVQFPGAFSAARTLLINSIASVRGKRRKLSAGMLLILEPPVNIAKSGTGKTSAIYSLDLFYRYGMILLENV
jgi:hypothetical protein